MARMPCLPSGLCEKVSRRKTRTLRRFAASWVRRHCGFCFAGKGYSSRLSSFLCRSAPITIFFKPGPLFSGPMFGLERWEFWHEAFIAVPDKKGASDECKRLAGKAAHLMVAIREDMTL